MYMLMCCSVVLCMKNYYEFRKESVHAREEVGPTEREETQACELWVVRLLVIGFKVREEVQVCFKGGIILVLLQHI